MINQYIARSLERKNRGVYFKKGKWLLHVVTLLAAGIGGMVKLNGDQADPTKKLGLDKVLPGFLVMVPFLVFFYFYCLYLIPYCFKQNRYRRFWTILGGLLLIFPLLDMGLELLVARHYPGLNDWHESKNGVFYILYGYWDFIRSFVGFTTILYIMELLEGIRTYRDIHDNNTALAVTESNLLKTRMDPEFMMHSLEGIIRLSEHKDAAAPGAVIGFSDILRYRLYRSQERLVPLPEELDYLEKLVLFSNHLNGGNRCALEVQGSRGPRQQLPPLAIVNIAESLINTYDAADPEWSLYLYLLAEDNELQIAAELQTALDIDDAVTDNIRNNLERVFGAAVIFAVEKTGNTYSIRICLPLYSNVS